MAEDGVTTNRYPIRFRLVHGGQAASAAGGPAALAGGGGDAAVNASAAAEWRSPGALGLEGVIQLRLALVCATPAAAPAPRCA